MKKVCVDESKCIGCGACVAIAPENFDFNEEGYSIVINEVPNEKVQDALEACPVFAITLEDVESTEKNNDNINLDSEKNCEDSCECEDDCNCEDKHGCCHECHCCQESDEQDEDNLEEVA